jgi:chemotaxis protein methyltransferase CheR
MNRPTTPMTPRQMRPANPPAAVPTGAGGGAAGLGELSAVDFQFLTSLIKQRSAIDLDSSKQYLLTSRLAGVVREERLASLTELVEKVRRSPRGAIEGKVIDAMTTNETSFFRDVHPFAALTDGIIPELLARGGPASQINVWCGACSSGQEPYSIALAVLDKMPDLVVTRRLRIAATDLSPTMVARTAAGKFSQLEVNRGMPARLLVKNFAQDGRDWVASRELRAVIEARPLNLIESWTGVPRCDVVFLRNVLIYFDTDTKRRILERIRKEILKPGGFLFLGSSETTLNIDPGYRRREFGKSICYQAPDAPGR